MILIHFSFFVTGEVMLQNVVQQKRFLKLYLLLFICAVVLLLLNNGIFLLYNVLYILYAIYFYSAINAPSSSE